MFVEVFKGKGKQPWYAHLVASNGKVITTSEGYTSRAAAVNAATKFFPDVELRVNDTE